MNIYWQEHQSSDEKIEHWSEGIIDNGIIQPKKTIGGYDIAGGDGGNNSIMFNMSKKPKWFNRVCTRFFLGWKWIDEEKKDNKKNNSKLLLG